MPNIRYLFVVFIALGGCQPVTTGGSGQTVDGQPVAGTISANAGQTEFTVLISSPAGWHCTGMVGQPESPTAIRSVPLKCNNASTGTILLTGNQYQQQVVGSFQLSNGQSGQVTFGLTS